MSPASPTITTTPSPSQSPWAPRPQTLTDSAVLSGGYYETGTITFTLKPGTTTVDTETVRSTATAPTPRPRLHAAHRGHGDGHLPVGRSVTAATATTTPFAASADHEYRRQMPVSPASPSITTTPNPTSYTLGTTTGDPDGHGGAFGRLFAHRDDHLHALRTGSTRWTRRRSRSTATAPTPRPPATRCRPRAR